MSPASAEYVTTLTPAQPGAKPVESISKFYRSATGMVRVDSGHTSIISNPAKQRAVLLDHLKKEVKAMPPPPPSASVPGVAAVPGMHIAPPAMNVKLLGSRILGGHEVEGKHYEVHQPTPVNTEVWTSKTLGLPMLSRTTGAFGQQVSHCKSAVPGEPAASLFQIPADYKRI